MAKKVKSKDDEGAEYLSFHFPHFDVGEFIRYELEQTAATFLAVALAVVVGVISWRMTVYGAGMGLGVDLSLLALLAGLGGGVLLPFVVGRLREKAREYRKGDWAQLFLIYLFLWLGLWSLLLNL